MTDQRCGTCWLHENRPDYKDLVVKITYEPPNRVPIPFGIGMCNEGGGSYADVTGTFTFPADLDADDRSYVLRRFPFQGEGGEVEITLFEVLHEAEGRVVCKPLDWRVTEVYND